MMDMELDVFFLLDLSLVVIHLFSVTLCFSPFGNENGYSGQLFAIV